jgi:Sulfotransferase family
MASRAARRGWIAPLRKVRDKVAKRFIIDHGGVDRSIFLAGAGRSGTTWLAEVINRAVRCRYMFEPFHNEKVSVWASMARFQYMREDDKDPKIFAAAENILRGKAKNDWIDEFNTVVIPHRRLIKEIRSNLMMAWLSRQFPEMPSVLVVRHPFAVMHSRMQLKWEPLVEVFRNQPLLMEDHLQPFVHLFDEVHDPYEVQALRWCIEHYVPLRQLAGKPVEIFYYEDFCESPAQTFKALFLALKIEGNAEEAIKEAKVPSRLVRKDSAVNTGQSRVQGWRKHFSPQQIDRVYSLLARFGLDSLYDSEGLPNHSGMNAARQAAPQAA